MRVFSNWIRRCRERAEIDRLGELDRLAQDIGVSTRDLEELVSLGRDPEQLSEMLTALCIDKTALARSEPAVLQDMQRLCGLCEASGICRRALDSGTVATAYRNFCVNAPTLDALKAEMD